jgi:hypothetical protein
MRSPSLTRRLRAAGSRALVPFGIDGMAAAPWRGGQAIMGHLAG